MDANKVKARIAGREAAKEILPLLSWPDGYGADFAESFIDEIRGLLPCRRVETPKEKPTPPIGRLGATTMPFGQHNGKTFDETPLEYLDWLCRSQEDFYRSLRDYLKHPELEGYRRGT